MNKQTTTLALTALLGAAGTALAGVPSPMTLGTHTTSRVVQNAPGFNFDSGDRDAFDLFGPAAMGTSRTYAGSTITVDSTASYGVLSNDIGFNGPIGSSSNDVRQARGFSEAGFLDNTLTLDAPAVNLGDLVGVTATFTLDFGFEMEFVTPREGSGFAFQAFTYNLELEIAGNLFTYAGQYRNFGDGTMLFSGDETPGTVTLDVLVPAGETFAISARLDSNYRAYAQNASFEGAFSTRDDAPHFTFDGFGSLPEGSSVNSQFANYVPTPASAALGLFALAGVAPRRRR